MTDNTCGTCLYIYMSYIQDTSGIFYSKFESAQILGYIPILEIKITYKN